MAVFSSNLFQTSITLYRVIFCIPVEHIYWKDRLSIRQECLHFSLGRIYVVVSSRCGTRLREQQTSEETTHETMVAVVGNPRLGNPVLCCYDDLLGIRHVCGYKPLAAPRELEILLRPQNSRRRFVGI